MKKQKKQKLKNLKDLLKKREDAVNHPSYKLGKKILKGEPVKIIGLSEYLDLTHD